MSSNRPTKQFDPIAVANRAKNVVRRLTGAERAYSEVAHVGQHLQNVEVSSNQRLANAESKLEQLLAEFHKRVQDYELRISQLEKTQALLRAGRSGALSAKSADVVATPVEYFEFYSDVLEAAESEAKAFTSPVAVVEFNCGAAKCSKFLAGKVSEYVGLDPSSILSDRAVETVRSGGVPEELFRFGVQDSHMLASLSDDHFDVAILIAEESNWSVAAAAKLFGVVACVLKENGKFIFSSPQPFAEMKAAGWDLQQELVNFGLIPQCEIDLNHNGKAAHVCVAARTGEFDAVISGESQSAKVNAGASEGDAGFELGDTGSMAIELEIVDADSEDAQ